VSAVACALSYFLCEDLSKVVAFSAKQPGIVEIPGCFHASSIPLEAAPQHQKPSEIWKNFLRLPPN
jgi:hypothetical protein